LVIALVPGLFAAPDGLSESVGSLLQKSEQASRWWNYNSALDYCNQAITIDTNDAAPFLVRAMVYERLGQVQKAEMDFDKAVFLAKDIRTQILAYEDRGSFFASNTNIEKAVDDYSRLIDINPKFAPVYVWRAGLYDFQKRYDRAIVDCNMALLLNPDAPEAYRCKANTYACLQDWDRAIATYTEALQHDTNHIWIFEGRAQAFYSKKAYPQAVADFDKLVSLQPTNPSALSSRGLCRSYTGDFRGGMEDCRKSIQLNTNFPPAYNNLAWLLATTPKSKLRNGQKAVDYATKACELTSWKNAYCLGTLAAAYAEAGDYSQAVKWENNCILAGLPQEEMEQAQKQLDLFEHKKPYHWSK